MAAPPSVPDRPTTATVSVRAARSGDLPEIDAIERRTFGNPWSLDAYAQELERPYGWLAVLEATARIVGFACAWQIGDEAHLLRIAIDPAVQRQGHGRRLLDAAVRRALEWGCGDLTLEVAAHNEPALALYRSRGFCEIGRRKAYYRCPVDDAIVMRRAL